MKNNIQLSLIIIWAMLLALKLGGIIEGARVWICSLLWLLCSLDIFFVPKSKTYKNPTFYGNPTYWDAKSGRIYGDFDIVDAEIN